MLQVLTPTFPTPTGSPGSYEPSKLTSLAQQGWVLAELKNAGRAFCICIFLSQTFSQSVLFFLQDGLRSSSPVLDLSLLERSLMTSLKQKHSSGDDPEATRVILSREYGGLTRPLAKFT